MINQVNSTNPNKDVFLPLQTSDIKYAVPKPITQNQKEGVKVEKEKKSNALGVSIATTAFVVGLILLSLAKGSSKTTRKNVNKLFRQVDKKTNEMGNKSELSQLEKFGFVALQKIRVILRKSKALFNLAPLKDVVVNRALKRNPTAKKIGDKITQIFEKISLKRSHRAYNHTTAKLDKMYASFDAANKKIPKAQAKMIEEKVHYIQGKYNEGFSKPTRLRRLETAKSNMSDLDQKVWDATYGDFKGFMKDSNYQKFVSEEKAVSAKTEFQNTIDKFRKEITNGKMDNYHSTKKILSNISDLVDPTDEKLISMVKKLDNNLEKYKNVVDVKNEKERLLLNNEISNNLKDLNKHMISTKQYDPKDLKKLAEYVKDVNDTIQKNKKGKLQEILSIYKENLSKEEYLKIKQQATKASESLDNSIDIEGDKLFDKVRDLMIGAAPTDVIGVLGSAGVVGWGLSKSENKDERTSVALKYGIPAIGGVLTTLYCTLGLIAGGPALIAGFLSGLVMNKAGVVVDNQVKKFKESKSPQV